MDDWTKGCSTLIQAVEASERFRVALAMALVPWAKAQTRAEIQFEELRGFAMAFGADPQAAVDAAVVTIREGLAVDEACQHAKRAIVDRMATGWKP